LAKVSKVIAPRISAISDSSSVWMNPDGPVLAPDIMISSFLGNGCGERISTAWVSERSAPRSDQFGV
jgi:hypothetical protein